MCAVHTFLGRLHRQVRIYSHLSCLTREDHNVVTRNYRNFLHICVFVPSLLSMTFCPPRGPGSLPECRSCESVCQFYLLFFDGSDQGKLPPRTFIILPLKLSAELFDLHFPPVGVPIHLLFSRPRKDACLYPSGPIPASVESVTGPLQEGHRSGSVGLAAGQTWWPGRTFSCAPNTKVLLICVHGVVLCGDHIRPRGD